MTGSSAPSLKKRTAAISSLAISSLIGALTLLAHAGVNAIHKREMRTEVVDVVRGFASEKDFIKRKDLAPITREIKDVHAEVNEQGQRLARMEGYLKAQLEMQRRDRRLRSALPGAHLEASAWELERPSRNF